MSLKRYEWLCIAYGVAAIACAVVVAVHERTPAVAPLVLLAGLSALSVHFSVPVDDGGKVSASAQAVVAAVAAVYYRDSAPLLAPLLVGMAGAFWRIPRSRHQWFVVPGNFAVYGLPALGAAAVVGALDLGPHPDTLVLAAAAIPASVALAAIDAILMTLYVSLCEGVSFRTAARAIATPLVAAAGYVPFLFGAFVGELSLRFGVVVFGFAAAAFVMVQAVFAGIRKLIESERETCDGLIAAVERKDPYTAGHSKRVVKFARYMGERLGFKGRDLARLEKQALMHDVGKLAVPNHVLRKPGKLDADERELMFRHEPAGAAILSQIPLLELSADIAAGRGHNDGLAGPVRAAHIVHAADSFDAMTSTRAYRRAKRQDDAHVEMERCAGTQFHTACVTALFDELDARGEVYGDGGIEADVAVYDTPPPEGALGETLADQAKADGTRRPEPPARSHVEIETSRHPLSQIARYGIVLGVVAMIAAVCAALLDATASVAVPIALAALVALGELVCLRPVRGVARPLSLVVIVTALASVALPVAAIVAATGVALGAALDGADAARTRLLRLARRAATAGAAVGAFAALDRTWPGTTSVAAALGTLVGATVAALVVQESAERGTAVRLAPHDRIADLALLASAPLTALATAGVGGHQGLGLGALPILVVPLALLAHGLDRTRAARENLFAWMRAASVAPEYANLVTPGRAERLVGYARGIARAVGLDEEMQDQLTAAAWMERVGECCLDESYVSGRPHCQEEIVEESAGILKSTKAFYAAGQVLYAMLREPELATGSAIDRAGQILRVAIAFEDATNGEIVPSQIPQLFAMLRHSSHHVLDEGLCDALQQCVAPGSPRSAWRPVQTHAILSCTCARAVDPFSVEGDDASCPEHGAQRIAALAFPAVRAHADDGTLHEFLVGMLQRTRRDPLGVRELQRELYVRLLPDVVVNLDPVVALAAAGCDTGCAWERDIADWMHEAGATVDQTADVLTAVGTTMWDAYQAIRSAYRDDELQSFAEPVATDGVSRRHGA